MIKKATIFAAILALVLVLAVPAFARGGDQHHNHNNNNFEVSQTNEQDVESGDSTQNMTITGGGDNSNQCAGVQGISNTGNATNSTSVLQPGAFENDGFRDHHRFLNGNRFNGGDEVEIDDTANFEIDPTSTTTCDQQVNQAASAFGG